MTPDTREALITTVLMDDWEQHYVYDGMWEMTARGGFKGFDNMTDLELIDEAQNNWGTDFWAEDYHETMREEHWPAVAALLVEYPTSPFREN